MGRTVVLAAVSGAVIAFDWLRVEEPRAGAGRAAGLVALAIVPALIRPLGLRVAVLCATLPFAAWLAFSVSPADLWPGGQGYLGELGARFRRGFLDFYEVRLPFDPSAQTRMQMVVLAAIFAFTLGVALLVAARWALAAVLTFLLGAGWPATLLAGGHELGRGAVILAGALMLLAGLSNRPGRLALPATAAVVLFALALSSSPAVAKSAFLDWQRWDFYNRPQKPVSVRFVWDANYEGVRFPKKRTTVLTIDGPRAALYWRATVLDRFVGDRWIENLRVESREERRLVVPRAADTIANTIRQDVTVGALDDDHLIGGTIPVAYNISEPARYAGQGVVVLPGRLHRKQRYTVWSYAPSPAPAELVRVPASYPAALTAPGRELEVAPGIDAAPFGVSGREAALRRRLTGRLEPYRQLLERARAVAGRTSSPYAAAIALETWLRSAGGFTYSEQPGLSPGVPPLVGFVTDTKTGYCQHFAGSMAFMLRLLGVPARVAAGFVSGKNSGTHWTVTDHDAHTWVEAWFRGYGWLPFDPTPGRGRLSQSYSSTSRSFNPAAAARLLAGLVTGGEVFGKGGRAGGPLPLDSLRPSPRSAADVGVRGLSAPFAENRHHSLLLFLTLLAAGACATLVIAKTARRRIRYLTRDPRRIASACGLELWDYVRDQRLTVSRGVTFAELGGVVEDELAVDATAFAQAATAARFGPPESASASARRARAELRELKRRLRRRLFVLDRVRGLVSLRSLGFS